MTVAGKIMPLRRKVMTLLAETRARMPAQCGRWGPIPVLGVGGAVRSSRDKRAGGAACGGGAGCGENRRGRLANITGMETAHPPIVIGERTKARPEAGGWVHAGKGSHLNEQVPIVCAEVWGSNRVVDMALNLPGIQGWIAARPHRGAAAGGDLHYVSSCGTGRISRFMLADVAGHGDAVSPLADHLRRLMHRYMNHIEPRHLARALNRDLSRFGDGGQFVTAVVMTFFAPNGRLTVCNAGHPVPAIYRADQRRWFLLHQPDTRNAGGINNLPLGVLAESGYIGRELTLRPGDMVMLYSDCLIEARNAEGQSIGQEGLQEVLNDLGPVVSPGKIGGVLEALLAAIQQRGFVFDDDMTAVILCCTERSDGASLREQLRGMARSFFKLWRRDAPWPEWSRANILGPWFKRFQSPM